MFLLDRFDLRSQFSLLFVQLGFFPGKVVESRRVEGMRRGESRQSGLETGGYGGKSGER